MEIYLSVKNFQKKSKLSTWIFRIAITKSLDLIRRKKRKKRFSLLTNLLGEKGEILHDPVNFNHPGIEAENKELAGILFNAISKLPESQEIAFTLNKIEGLKYQQISDIMNVSIPAIESLLFRAKQNLKKHLAKYYEELNDRKFYIKPASK